MFEELRPHLIELRKRLFISVVCLVAMFFICFAFRTYLLEILKNPVEKALPEFSNKMVFTQLTETLFAAVQVSFFAALLLSLPIIFWQFWKFVAPGLYENEKKLVIPFVSFATLMFVLGSAFCYFIVVPMAYAFLIEFGTVENFTPLISFGPYVGFFIKLMLGFGLSFELPVLAFFFAKLGLIDDAFMKRHFRVAVLLIFVFAAIMTPPDVISQILMALPLCGLYALSIFIVKKVNPAQKDSQDEG